MKKYDLILPLGSACKTTHNLRKRNLQRESLPFDWILLLDTQVIIQLLRSHFQGFLVRENMKKKELENTLHDVYVDVSSKIEFWHDFPLNCNFDEMFDYATKVSEQAIDEVDEGFIEAKPVKDECKFCPYLSVCRHSDNDGVRIMQKILDEDLKRKN